MVKEISYEDYKDLGTRIGNKGVLCFISNLFVKKKSTDDTIYFVKLSVNADDTDVTEYYNSLCQKGLLTKLSLSEFNKGVVIEDKTAHILSNVYSDKNILIVYDD